MHRPVSKELKRIFEETSKHLQREHSRFLEEVKPGERKTDVIETHRAELAEIKNALSSNDFGNVSRRAMRLAIRLLESDIEFANKRLKHFERLGEEAAREEWNRERETEKGVIYSLPFEGLMTRLRNTVKLGPTALSILEENLREKV